MILKKKKAVIAAILSAALTASAVMPTVSAGTRTKEEAYGDSTYAQRFLSLYDDVITNGEENGYLSSKNKAVSAFLTMQLKNLLLKLLTTVMKQLQKLCHTSFGWQL